MNNYDHHMLLDVEEVKRCRPRRLVMEISIMFSVFGIQILENPLSSSRQINTCAPPVDRWMYTGIRLKRRY